MAAQLFDRIYFTCTKCGNKGLIASVSVNLTFVILDGFCHVCRRAEAATFDLLEIDRKLKREGQTEPCGNSELRFSISIPTHAEVQRQAAHISNPKEEFGNGSDTHLNSSEIGRPICPRGASAHGAQGAATKNQ